MMNVPRRMTNGKVNTNEPHQQQIWITSAGPKTTFAYEKLIELLVNEVIDPDDYFVCGSSYELPVYYDVLDKNFLDEQRMSPTFDMDSFSREALSLNKTRETLNLFNCWNLLKLKILQHSMKIQVRMFEKF